MGKIAIGLLAALLLSLLPTPATAQQPSVSILSLSTRRDHQQNAGKVPITQISREDCLTEDWFDFTLELEQYQAYALEVWVGSACDTRSARQGSTATCWNVHSAQPQSEIFRLSVGVRDLLRGRTGGNLIGEEGTSSDVPDCEPTSSALAPQIVHMYAMLLDANGEVAASSIWQSTYKLVPPTPQHVVSVASGDRQLSVELSSMISDQTFNGVQLFCDPAPNDPNAVANVETTSTDAGVFVPSCSPSSELVPGADAASLQHLRCGGAPRLALTAIADGLVNGVSYNIATASVDTYGNIGSLSEVACQVPQARESDQRVQACTFAGSAQNRRGSALLWLAVFGVVLSRRCLNRHGRRSWAP